MARQDLASHNHILYRKTHLYIEANMDLGCVVDYID
jgi:hypothetical protein